MMNRFTPLAVCCALLALGHLSAHAEIKLLGDWDKPYPDGTPLPIELRRGPVDIQGKETARLEAANWESLSRRVATPSSASDKSRQVTLGMGYRLHFGQDLYYFTALGFMPKTRPDEVCTPEPFVNRPTYRCVEGGRYTKACHIAIYNRRFEEVGWHTIRINAGYPHFCNAVPGMGRLDAEHDEVLVEAQYFAIDGPIAAKPGDIGQGWHRQTARLKLKRTPEGRIDIEQDDKCLGNPNEVDEIPEARRAIKRCEQKATR